MPIGGHVSGGGGGGGAPASAWTVEAEVDFTSLPPHDFLSAGTATDSVTIDAVPWQAACGGSPLSSYADTFEIVAGVGLQIQPKATGGATTDFYGSSTIAPRLGPRLLDIIPSYDYSGDTIAVQAYTTVDVTLSDTYQAFGICFDRHVSNHGNWMAAQAKFSGLASPNELIAELITQTREYYANPPQYQAPDLFEIIVPPRMGLVQGSVSDWQGSFPKPGAPLVANGWAGIRGASVIKNMSGPTAGTDTPDDSDGYASVLAHNPWSVTSFTATTTKMRFLRLVR